MDQKEGTSVGHSALAAHFEVVDQTAVEVVVLEDQSFSHPAALVSIVAAFEDPSAVLEDLAVVTEEVHQKLIYLAVFYLDHHADSEGKVAHFVALEACH